MNKVARVGIILGTGTADGPARGEALNIETPYGNVDVRIDGPLVFLSRHGATTAPAHSVNHKANIEALARCNAARVIGVHSVGALVDSPSGALVVPDDFLDLGGQRDSYYDNEAKHVDVSEPFCPTLRRLLVAQGATDGGVYAQTRGPRLETRAEVRALRQLGGTVVGMTAASEAALARERGLCFASLCVVTNAAAAATEAEIRASAKALARRALDAALGAASAVPAERSCRCAL